MEPSAIEATVREGEQAFLQGRFDVTLACGQRLLTADPSSREGFRLSGIALSQLGRVPEALRMLEAATRADPTRGDAWAALATTLTMANRSTEALAAARRAVELGPGNAQAHGLLATLLMGAGDFEAAERHYMESLSLEPGLVPAAINLGAVWTMTGRAHQAVDLYRETVKKFPGFPPLLTNLSMTLNYATAGASGVAVTPEETLAAHRAYGTVAGSAQSNVPRLTQASPWPNSRDARRVIRVGILSYDLNQHSVASFLLAALQHKDRAQVQYIGYTTNSKIDDMTRRLGPLFDGWRDVSTVGDTQIIQQIRADQCDILLELSGHTYGHKQMALALRAAPVQATWCGYPNTTGNPAIDFRIVDSITDPDGSDGGAQRWCSERLLRIDPCFLCFSGETAAPHELVPPSAEQGFITFGSFNAIKKFSPRTAELWASVLHAVPTSRLVIKSEGLQAKAARDRIRTVMKELGIPEVRLELVERMASKDDHLRAYGGVDIALDTFPYNGTTTTCEALWQGVPVVARLGDVHAARVSASLLHAVGLPELVANTDDGYVRIARDLATNAERLHELRQTLRARMQASPLCDGPAFARRFEGALRKMWASWCG